MCCCTYVFAALLTSSPQDRLFGIPHDRLFVIPHDRLFVIPDMSYKSLLLELFKAEVMSETHMKDSSKAWLTVFEGLSTLQFNNVVIQYPLGAVWSESR